MIGNSEPGDLDRPTFRAVMAALKDPESQCGYHIDNPDLPEDWLIKGLIPEKSPGILFGAGAVGKGHMQFAMAIHLALGRDFGPFKITKPGRTLIVSTEDTKKAMHRRNRAALRVLFPDLTFPSTECEDRIRQGYFPISLNGIAGLHLENPDLLDAIGEQVASVNGVDLVFLDSLAMLTPSGLDINTQDGGRRVIDAIATLSRKLNASVGLVHHASKAGASTDRNRDLGVGAQSGSGFITDLARWVLRCTNMSGSDAKSKFGFDRLMRYVVMELVKMNEADMTGSTVWSREPGGALGYCPLPGLSEREEAWDQAMLDALLDLGEGGATDKEWQEICSSRGIPRNVYRAGRDRLVSAGRVAANSEERSGNRGGRRPRVFRVNIAKAATA